MHKTTVFLDESLLSQAMDASGARTKREAIEEGLKELVRKHNREKLRRELGSFDIDLTPEELERLRSAS